MKIGKINIAVVLTNVLETGPYMNPPRPYKSGSFLHWVQPFLRKNLMTSIDQG